MNTIHNQVCKVINYLLFFLFLIMSCDSPEKNKKAQIQTNTLPANMEQSKQVQSIPCHDSLLEASMRGDFKKVEFLIRNGANVNCIDSEGQTALMYASSGLILEPIKSKIFIQEQIYKIRIRKHNICSLLIKSNCEVNAIDYSGATALHYAAIWKDSAICAFLIKNGADVNIQDTLGNTALHYFISKENSKNIISFFVNSGADTTLKNKDGKSITQYLHGST